MSKINKETNNITYNYSIGEKLTRIIVSVSALEEIIINVTQHIITDRFSENGLLIDHTFFKVYISKLGIVKSSFIDVGYGSEVWISGNDEDEISRYENMCLEFIKGQIEADLSKVMKFKHVIDSDAKSYISEVDRTPWGIKVPTIE